MRPLPILILTAAVAILAASCSSSEDTTTTAAPATTTTAAEETTTTAAEATTTTTEAETEDPAAVMVDPTTAIGILQPYSDGGADLFPAGSVEANWYQWDGSYVVLYRGFDASAGQEICAGNSILVEGIGFNDVTNSPYLGAADEICVGAAAILEPPEGVQVCGPLLYYLTAIPIDKEGTLYGTLEIGTAPGFEGQTSQAASDASVPEFEPGLAAYELPPSGVDDLGIVACGT